MAKIYVCGHVNPDLDAIASAIGYAWALAQGSSDEIVAVRAGPVNAQTTWALRRLGLEPPELLADASPHFDVISRRLDTVTPDRPLSEAWMIANRTGGVAPVVEADGKPYGLISGMSLFGLLSRLVGMHPERHDMRIAEFLGLASREAADTGAPRFPRTARIRDVLPRVLREGRDDFWVVDEAGRYAGLCQRADLLNPPRLKLVLVDHNEVGQSLGALEEAELLEVLDHHRLGNAPTRLPIRFRVDPVGSTGTLVSERIEDDGLSAPPEIAGLLLAGLIADTLDLTSPTTTERDHVAKGRLARWAFVGGSPLEGESLEVFSRQVLEAGAGLATRDPDSVVTGDLKVYTAGGKRFAISQVEVTDMLEVGDRLGALGQSLERLREEKGLDFAVLMVTDIVDGSSRILTRGAAAALEDLPYPPLADGSLDARGVVSRKKQLLPAVLAILGA
jgi:manganese-dependent inorganic pyrophosphatase